MLQHLTVTMVTWTVTMITCNMLQPIIVILVTCYNPSPTFGRWLVCIALNTPSLSCAILFILSLVANSLLTTVDTTNFRDSNTALSLQVNRFIHSMCSQWLVIDNIIVKKLLIWFRRVNWFIYLCLTCQLIAKNCQKLLFGQQKMFYKNRMMYMLNDKQIT